MNEILPSRGEIWLLDLNPVKGHEQAGQRPCLVISDDTFNHGPADLALILPLTSKEKRIPLHVEVKPPEGGLHTRSFIMCENIRSVSQTRFSKRLGAVHGNTLHAVEDRLRILMDL